MASSKSNVLPMTTATADQQYNPQSSASRVGDTKPSSSHGAPTTLSPEATSRSSQSSSDTPPIANGTVLSSYEGKGSLLQPGITLLHLICGFIFMFL